MNEELLVEISKKLSVLISLSLRHLGDERDFGSKAKRRQGVGEQVRYLAEFGLDAKEIAAIVGSPVASVRTLLTPGRKK